MKTQISDKLMEALQDLGRFLSALGPYAENTIVVGGMVPVIYRYLQNVSPVQQNPMTTFDLDIAVPGRLKTLGNKSLSNMLTDGGFAGHLRGATPPPATVYQHVRHGDTLAAIYVELLTPLAGSENTRDGKRRVQTEIQQEVTAQLIRYLDLLQLNPLTINCIDIPVLGIPEPERVLRIPNPGMYIIQKVLCREKRRSNKKDKDLAYVYDVVTLFRKKWEEIGEEILKVERDGPKYKNWINKASKSLAQLFESQTSDGPIAVVREISTSSTGVTLTEAAVHQIMTKFLDESGLLER